ncbi:hypothetical protein AXF42_Ash009040 [Apostasia shenzhenica]|uniref:Uncharacterized protein n=1 Tax=Apostasia shenzhenica TaxID=1088818 RepID=A0A2I0ADC2_9ASPA|nr:hypothetical protein AXF42_Ash009040 [Apostasia shenzhenica]
MSLFLLSCLAFAGLLSSLADARSDPVPARSILLELGVETQTSADPPLPMPLRLSPGAAAPEVFPHLHHRRPKLEVAAAEAIAVGFVAAVVAAIFIYIRVTRNRSGENSKY